MSSSQYSDRLPPLLRSHGQVTTIANSGFRKRLFSTTEPTEIDFGYHRAIRKGPFIFVSGTTASKLFPELDAEEERRRSRTHEASGSGHTAKAASRISVGSGFVMAPTPPPVRVSAGSGFVMSPEIPTTIVPVGSGFVVAPESPPPYEDNRSTQEHSEAQVSENTSTGASKQSKQSPEQSQSQVYVSQPTIPYRQSTETPPVGYSTQTHSQNLDYRSRIHFPDSTRDQARIALARAIEAMERLRGEREDKVRARIYISRREDSQVVGEEFRKALSVDTMARYMIRGQNERIKKGQAGICVGEVGVVVTMVVVDGFMVPDVRVMVELDAIVE